MEKRRMIRRFVGLMVFSVVVCLSFCQADARDIVGEPALHYEISEGNLVLVFTGLTQADILDITWDGDSIVEDIFDTQVTDIEYTEDGFILKFKEQLPLESQGIIEVLLTNGQKLHKTLLATSLPSLGWVLSSGTCSVANGWTSVQCDSVRSDVGTPPYPCCDNNGDGRVTGSNDGNCTWYVWYKAKKVMGWSVPSNWGNAGSWCSNAAKTPGWKVTSMPRVNSIACSSSIGHVFWVESVSSDKKTVTGEEMNCKVPPYCVGTGLQKTKPYNASSFQYIYK